MEGIPLHKWTNQQTRSLIRLRSENDHLFTGKRHTAKKAWAEILQQMGLLGYVSPTQVAKKWDNLKRKYKELRNPTTGAGADRGETTAANWPWFAPMHEAVAGTPLIDIPALFDSCVAANPGHVADGASDGGGSSPPGSVAASRSQVWVEEVDEDEEAQEEDDPQPGSGSFTREDGEPSTSACPPPPKRRRTSPGAVLEFLKEEAVREDERFRATQESTNRFLDLFERMVDKIALVSKADGRRMSALVQAALVFFKTGLLPSISERLLIPAVRNVYPGSPSLCQKYVRKTLMEGQTSTGWYITLASTSPTTRPMTKDKVHPSKYRSEDNTLTEEKPYLKTRLRYNYDPRQKPKKVEWSSYLSANGILNIPSLREILLHPTRLHEDYCTPKSVQWAKGVWKKANCDIYKKRYQSRLRKFSIKVTAKWEWLSVDLRGPLPETLEGRRFLLIVMDLYSKWAEVYPMRTSSAREVALNIRNLVCQLGLPHALFSHLSKSFIKAVNKALGIYMAMEDCSLVVYHPKACRLDPTTHSDVSSMVEKLVEDHKESWDLHLHTYLFALRIKEHPKTGQSPFYSLYCRDPQKDSYPDAPQKLLMGLGDEHPISRILASPPLTVTQEPRPSSALCRSFRFAVVQCLQLKMSPPLCSTPPTQGVHTSLQDQMDVDAVVIGGDREHDAP
ncbi:hypothetical protein SKAU_G00301240 [Synaphobranchus kaupii]|uniref:Integrase catalytic domain-containing protein n=1 Tax=Synaphobranchus kaupii TaxID=118154 RepID=A0A9Q1EVT2_SYNKA|nr:hypothetical protein SKAU_G00301240 [Synaphobranchus kaupii]